MTDFPNIIFTVEMIPVGIVVASGMYQSQHHQHTQNEMWKLFTSVTAKVMNPRSLNPPPSRASWHHGPRAGRLIGGNRSQRARVQGLARPFNNSELSPPHLVAVPVVVPPHALCGHPKAHYEGQHSTLALPMLDSTRSSLMTIPEKAAKCLLGVPCSKI